MLNFLSLLPLDPIFQLLYDFQADPRKNKVNLGIGIYVDEEGKPFVFPSLKKAVAKLDRDNFNYQPIGGNREYLELVAKLLLKRPDFRKLAMVATCGGTQACRLFSDLLFREGKKSICYIGHPTWSNHLAIFKAHRIRLFPHITPEGEVNVEAYRQTITSAPVGSVLILHGGLCHNPSGKNLSKQDLQYLIPMIKSRQLIVFVDFAYLGMGEGFEKDDAWLDFLMTELQDVAVAISFSKNLSLYEHRTGILAVKTKHVNVIESHLQELLRQSISMAPGFGQEMVIRILTEHKKAWLSELEACRMSIEKRKKFLIAALPSRFRTLLDCRGLFGLLSLRPDQIVALRKDHAIYLPQNGRINFAGIQIKAINRIAEGILAVL